MALLLILSSFRTGFAGPTYDIIYLWDDSLDNVLDYQSQLAELLGDEVARQLRIVQHDDGRFGVIYDHNGTALSSAQIMIQHSEVLRSAEFSECLAIQDNDYDELFNVSYGLGPNLDALKKVYDTIYRVLGSEVGSNLFIEQTGAGNYTLIYRRRGDRSSTYAVAKRHAKMLKRFRISTTIIAENNNPVVFGEASMLDDQSVEPPPQKQVVETVHKQPIEPERPTLSTVTDSTLSRSIEELINDIRRQGNLLGEERTGWMVYDLANDRT
ncbi:MAG: hypothetical protein IH612_10060, partial [Desulfofustis sp.]|nr:hypothetical protein [Desulfofustis sp.]